MLAQALASLSDSKHWSCPIHHLCAAHSTHVMSYHTVQRVVASAQRHLVTTLLCLYRVLHPSSMQEGHNQQTWFDSGRSIHGDPGEWSPSWFPCLGVEPKSIIIPRVCTDYEGNEWIWGRPSEMDRFLSSPHLQAFAEECISTLPTPDSWAYAYLIICHFYMANERSIHTLPCLLCSASYDDLHS